MIRRFIPQCLQGSSLLTRGKPNNVYMANGFRGLIPAYAGKTGCSDRRMEWGTAHPCLRGENQFRPSLGIAMRGSSLLTRGKLPLLVSDGAETGLIPAYAGKTT